MMVNPSLSQSKIPHPMTPTTPITETAAAGQNCRKLKINLLNKAAVKEAIAKAEGRAKARIASPDHATNLALWADGEMNSLGLPKKYRAGAKATYLPGAVCGSYGHAADGTWLEITRGADGWFLTGVDRREVGSGHGGTYDRLKLQLTLEHQTQAVKSNPHFAALAYHLAELKDGLARAESNLAIAAQCRLAAQASGRLIAS